MNFDFLMKLIHRMELIVLICIDMLEVQIITYFICYPSPVKNSKNTRQKYSESENNENY